MKDGSTNTRRLKGRIWGDSLLNKLPARSRTKRKRQASKARRALLKKLDDHPA